MKSLINHILQDGQCLEGRKVLESQSEFQRNK